MMQKTDFEFELIIGEDCSQDKTREICFDYQKKYPDKIRVLWWHENISKLGGNSRRVFSHCRGEFIALCEGDDYWIDSLKLQKQVDIMRKYPDVGLCFCNSNIYDENSRKMYPPLVSRYSFGKISGHLFLESYFCDIRPKYMKSGATHIMTATAMSRAYKLRECLKKYDIFNWELCLGDKTIWLALATVSNVFYLNDIVSVYRQQQSGAMATLGSRIYRDSAIVSFYFMRSCYEKNVFITNCCRYGYVLTLILNNQPRLSTEQQQSTYKQCLGVREVKKLFSFANNKMFQMLWKFGWLRPWMGPFFSRYLYYRFNTFDKIKLSFSMKR